MSGFSMMVTIDRQWHTCHEQRMQGRLASHEWRMPHLPWMDDARRLAAGDMGTCPWLFPKAPGVPGVVMGDLRGVRMRACILRCSEWRAFWAMSRPNSSRFAASGTCMDGAQSDEHFEKKR